MKQLESIVSVSFSDLLVSSAKCSDVGEILSQQLTGKMLDLFAKTANGSFGLANTVLQLNRIGYSEDM